MSERGEIEALGCVLMFGLIVMFPFIVIGVVELIVWLFG